MNGSEIHTLVAEAKATGDLMCKKSATEGSEIITKYAEETKRLMNESIKELGEASKSYIEKIRVVRMTTTTEIASMMKPLQDVRQFFIGEDHDKQVERLKEFVDLCERLKKLKDSGFLDTVADTMLKLA